LYVFGDRKTDRSALTAQRDQQGRVQVMDQGNAAASIMVGGGGEGHAVQQHLLLGYGNRHGLIAGATGTGKTITLQVLAEGFSACLLYTSDAADDM
jgi:hypothetical protein